MTGCGFESLVGISSVAGAGWGLGGWVGGGVGGGWLGGGSQPEVYREGLAGNQRAAQTPSDADWALVRQPPWARPGLNAT